MAHMENEFLSKKYQKWDNFKDDEDEEAEVIAPTLYDPEKDGNYSVYISCYQRRIPQFIVPFIFDICCRGCVDH
jgi:hypothetical protein